MKRVLLLAVLGVVVCCRGMIAFAAGGASQVSSGDGDGEGAKRQSVGLVLSGGGAKGIAHIGVIQALEDNDIPIDYIAGTSMGSIVGGFYAAGYTPQEMMRVIESREFTYWSTGRIDPDLEFYFSKPEPTPELVSFPVNLTRHKRVTRYPSSLISPLPMSFAFMELFAPYTAQCRGDFDELFVPFRCVTSDVKNKHKIVCRSGHLSDAIRASMSFPVVFQPIEMDSVLVYDGGIYDNFPVDVMREDFAPSIMIGVDVHGSTDPADAHTLINQIEDMVIQNNDYDLPADEGIKLRINLDEYSLLDFQAAKAIYDIGYAHAMAMMDSIKERVTSRTPSSVRCQRRREFNSATPGLRFDSVEVTGGTHRQNAFLKYLFTHNSPDTFGISSARLAFYRAITPGRLYNLTPQANYDSTTGLFDLSLRANVKNNFNIGLGCYLTSSVNSMAFLSARFTSLSFNTVDASMSAWIGQSYMAASLRGSLLLPTHVPTALTAVAVVSRRKYYETDKIFMDASTPTFVSKIEAFGRLGYEVALGRTGRTGIAVGGGTLINRFYGNDHVDYAAMRRDETRFNLGQLRWSVTGSTLDNEIYPTQGYNFKGLAMWNVGKYRFHGHDLSAGMYSRDANWAQLEAKGAWYGHLSKHFALGGCIDALYSSCGLLDTYNATLVNSPAYVPTPVADSYFNPAFRAYKFLAAGIVPIWLVNDNMQLRYQLHLFQPYEQLQRVNGGHLPAWGKPWGKRYVYTELAAVINLRFALLSVYGNYQSYPARNWNVGISFGLYFPAQGLLR